MYLDSWCPTGGPVGEGYGPLGGRRWSLAEGCISLGMSCEGLKPHATSLLSASCVRVKCDEPASCS